MRSKRSDASEIRPSERLVRLIDSGSKQADSSKMFTVFSETSVSSPPITPAKATGPLGSQIIRVEVVNGRSVPSNVVRRSPSSARRTMMAARPCESRPNVSRSKAWRG